MKPDDKADHDDHLTALVDISLRADTEAPEEQSDSYDSDFVDHSHAGLLKLSLF
ncbi:TPA: hypothetical protein I8Y95_001713 [Legionella pneumophila]|nr:hypothetical protein [Legionella pneumophila]HAT1761276.1 hypothetical protein [Legionella pneumophila]HAT1763292.1 hypothetical protein [Legionella pneumophila]HAT1766361.1 hypothetical protein [Legionella pneumophila]HAT1812202.1 hypothetical protein [Legionella pneumophila]